MKVKYIVICSEELQVLRYGYYFIFKGRTPQEAVRRHNEFYKRRDELFGKCKCFIGTTYEEKEVSEK